MWVVVNVQPTGMLWMMPVGPPKSLSGLAWWALEVLSEGRLMSGTNEFAVLRQRCLGKRLVRNLLSAAPVSASLKSASFLRQSPVVNRLCSIIFKVLHPLGPIGCPDTST